ncbi:hypothetical protein HWV62_35921 [Athelia sp. TMB]|nr:hypothetical protein HWV62_35921 [Athelia sp. TMB]
MSEPLDGRQWVTLEEQLFLEDKIPAFTEAQKNHKRYHKFWPILFRDWFQRFPLRAITAVDLAADVIRMGKPSPADRATKEQYSDAPLDSPEEEAFAKTALGKRKRKESKRKESKVAKAAREFEESKLLTAEQRITQWLIRSRQEQLKSWMRRHAPAVPRPPRTKTGNIAFPAIDMFSFASSDNPGRALQETEVYIDLYHQTRLKPIVQQRAIDQNLQGPQINLVRQVAREMYSQEDKETRAAVAAQMAALQLAKKKEEEELAEAQAATHRTPEHYQKSIDTFPKYIDGVLKNVAEHTGFAVTLIMGGPVPTHKGAISTLCYHVGKNEFGSAFGAAHPNFKEDVIRPFTDFLRTVYPSEVRAARSLTAKPAAEDLETIEPHTRPNSPTPGPSNTMFTPPPDFPATSRPRVLEPPTASSPPVQGFLQQEPPTPPTAFPSVSSPQVPDSTPVSSPPVLGSLLQDYPASALPPSPSSAAAPCLVPSAAPVSCPPCASPPSPLSLARPPLPTVSLMEENTLSHTLMDAAAAANPSPRLSRIAQKAPAVPRPKPRPSIKAALRKRAEEEARTTAAGSPTVTSSGSAASGPTTTPIQDAKLTAVSPASTPTVLATAEATTITPISSGELAGPVHTSPAVDEPRPRRLITLMPLAAEAQCMKEQKEAATAAAAAKKAAKLLGQPLGLRGRGGARGGQRGVRGGQRGARGSKSSNT